eukprot:3186201-Prymnesium_polylepis.3
MERFLVREPPPKSELCAVSAKAIGTAPPKSKCTCESGLTAHRNHINRSEERKKRSVSYAADGLTDIDAVGNAAWDEFLTRSDGLVFGCEWNYKRGAQPEELYKRGAQARALSSCSSAMRGLSMSCYVRCSRTLRNMAISTRLSSGWAMALT